MPLRILLLNPHYTTKERYASKVEIKKGCLVPLGLALLGAVLKKEGHRVKVLDLQVNNYSLEDIVRIANRFKPRIIGITALALSAHKVFRMIELLNKGGKGKPLIVFGGPHATAFPKKSMEENPGIGAVCIGEGEETFKEIAAYIEKKHSLKDVKGIYYRDSKSRIVKNKSRPMIEDLDKLPFPDRGFFDLRKYIPLPNQYKQKPVANMITSRGCSYAKCTFCFEAGLFGHKFRRQSPERVIEEIKFLVKKYGVREISFWDDNFVVGKQWMERFAELLEKEGIKISWGCYARVNFVSPEILRIMKKAGCWTIFYGIESGNQKLLDKIRKGITIEEIEKAVKWTEEAGIESRGAFMLALPGETPKMAEKTIEFALRLPLDYAQFALTTPYPGSVLFDQCSEDGKINYDYTRYGSFEPVFIPKAYKSEEELKGILKSAYRRFYFRPSYIWRRLSKIRSVEDIKRGFEGLLFLIGMTS